MAGVLSAFGAVAALYDRGRRGHTYRVNTSLAQTALLEQMPFAVDGADVDPSRGGTRPRRLTGSTRRPTGPCSSP